MRKSNRKTPLVFRIGLALVCALLVSTYMMSGMYARYCTTASGDDSARIAKFSISEDDQWDSVDVDVKLNFYNPAHLESTLDFTVSSDSEVAVQYDVIITLPDDLASYEWLVLTLSRDMGASVTAARVDNVYTITAAGTFAASDTTDTHNCKLTFSIADANRGNPPAGLSDIKDGNIQLTVHAEQID